MITLVFDTCFNKSYIYLKIDDKINVSKSLISDDKNYHTAYLIPQICEILKENKLFVKDIDVIGVNIGPGSFTGIRAGLTIARVLSQQANIKLVGVNSFEILSKINNTEKRTIIALDARKNMVYFSDGILIKPQLIQKDSLKDYIDDDCFVITDSSINLYLKEAGINSLCYEDCSCDFGKFLSDIVNCKLTNEPNNDFHWAKVKPLYIQEPSITKPKTVIR